MLSGLKVYKNFEATATYLATFKITINFVLNRRLRAIPEAFLYVGSANWSSHSLAPNRRPFCHTLIRHLICQILRTRLYKRPLLVDGHGSLR